MKKISQWILIAIILVITVITIYTSINSSEAVSKDSAKQPETQEYPEIGYLAPSFKLKDLNGQVHELKDYRGKPVILNFWASWCGPCIQEAPNFVKLDSTYKGEVQVLTINLTTADSVKSAQEFVKQYGFTFPTLLDQEGTAAKSYRIKPIPTTFFINNQGLIVDGVYGGLTWEDIESRTKQLIQVSNK